MSYYDHYMQHPQHQQHRRGGSYGPKDPEHETYRKLFIGGLSYDTTEETLHKYFEQWGKVVDCVIMKDPSTKRSRGFGFVTYKESGMVDKAQDKRPHRIDGREVESKRAMPREESGNPDAQVSVKKMFIGGLSLEASEEQVRDVFDSYGKVEGVTFITDKATGKRKGFAFVEFDDYDPVDKAVLKKFHMVNGKEVEAKKAQNKDQQMGWGGRGGGGGGGGRGGSRGGRGGHGGYAAYGNGGYGDGYNDGYGSGGYGYQQGYGGGSWGPGSGYNGYGGAGYGSQGGWGGGHYSSGGYGGDGYSGGGGQRKGYNSGGYGRGGYAANKY